MGGAASYEVKSCGNAHAWCSKCRPEVAAGQRKPKPPPKPGMPPCRKCGSCDYCRGMAAPEGMKVCRQCGETKPLSAFYKRKETRTYRNQCMKCMNGGQEPARCEGCGRKFHSYGGSRKLCAKCRPPIARPCDWCGAQFTGSMENRRYCSATCRDAAFKDKRGATRRAQRIEALRAYSNGGEPACACCGETTPMFLAIDHVNGGGFKQREELGGGGFYTWLRKNNYPEGFQLLCHNCNLGRQLNGGICPHVAT
jgi:hypothetical protein